jgi:metal-responsive CopG/Arc/MetJ family transcriptional regulator
MKECNMAKIAISLPDEILKDVEKERLVAGETRSEFFRKAVETYFRYKRQKEQEEQYIRGYREFPESVEDLGGLEELGLAAWAEVPWEEE